MTVAAPPERVTVEVIRTVTSDGDEEEEVVVPPTASLVLQDDKYADLNMLVDELTRWREQPHWWRPSS